MKIIDGWLVAQQGDAYELKQSASPFFNQRADNIAIDTLVIHNISLPPGEFGGTYIEDLFLGCLNVERHPSLKDLKGLEVSSHLLIRRDGLIQQFVAFDKRAWHAGVSEFCGRENCNDFSIGIELEGADSVPYTQHQYAALCLVTALIQANYDVEAERIVGHVDIAPQRKTDPGEAFDWAFYKSQL